MRLDPNNRKAVKGFSLGMKQRLGIAMALLGDYNLVVLDEPFTGLDPAGMEEIRELIRNTNRNTNKTFLISSHLLAGRGRRRCHRLCHPAWRQNCHGVFPCQY
ncbi:MAG: AAA family ATPase [Bacillota bacterium]